MKPLKLYINNREQFRLTRAQPVLLKWVLFVSFFNLDSKIFQ